MIPHDKCLHYIAGNIAAGVGKYVAIKAGVDPVAGAVSFAIAAGALKECYDFATNKLAEKNGQPAPHTVDGKDFLATALGCIPFVL